MKNEQHDQPSRSTLSSVLISTIALLAACGGITSGEVGASVDAGEESGGDKGEGELCSTDAECQRGLSCVGDEPACRAPCATADECADGYACQDLGGSGEISTQYCVCEPTTEVCDGIDNDCDPNTADGSADPGLGEACMCEGGELVCVLCDGSPHRDLAGGYLRLMNAETYGVEGSVSLSSVCTDPGSRINMCSDVTINLSGGASVGGLIGPLGDQELTLEVKSMDSDPIYLRVDMSVAPMTVLVTAPYANVYVQGVGSETMTYGASAKGSAVYTQGPLINAGVTTMGGDNIAVAGGPEQVVVPACP